MHAAPAIAMFGAIISGTPIPLVTFDGAAASTFAFMELNDPVMGGQSTGKWIVSSEGFGHFSGEVKDVPSLKAPGFIKAAAEGKFSDVSAALGGDLVLTVKTSTPSYTGFRVSFAAGTSAPSYACGGGGSIPFSRGCFKAPFSVPASGSSFVDVHVPFSSFSDMWSPATGKQTKSCAKDADVCPTAKDLKRILRVEVWAEGVDGVVALDVKAITAIPADVKAITAVPADGLQSTVANRPPTPFGTCSAAVQPQLRFGISGRTRPDVPVPLDPHESLAEAVCCDSRARLLAEPQFLFEAPDIDLFARLPDSGTTTFYDSVCGVPLFRAPVGRSRADFFDDTMEHGWPSFRPAEVIKEHVMTNQTSGLVTSSCGTHLGSYLPDARGPRWCMECARARDSNRGWPSGGGLLESTLDIRACMCTIPQCPRGRAQRPLICMRLSACY